MQKKGSVRFLNNYRLATNKLTLVVSVLLSIFLILTLLYFSGTAYFLVVSDQELSLANLGIFALALLNPQIYFSILKSDQNRQEIRNKFFGLGGLGFYILVTILLRLVLALVFIGMTRFFIESLKFNSVLAISTITFQDLAFWEIVNKHLGGKAGILVRPYSLVFVQIFIFSCILFGLGAIKYL